MDGNEQLLNSAGRPGTMSEISIRNADGEPLAVGQLGEIWIRSEMLMQGYMNLPGETAQVLREGWLSTNDIGRLDQNGYLFLHDRKNFMIITGAVNVFPSTVEIVLREFYAVDEVVVVGAPDPEWGEAVVAVVKLRNDAEVSERDVVAFAQQKLSKMECPKRVFFVEEFPMTVTNKIDKRTVKSWVASEYIVKREV
jgi:acyl-CoA synthetase (AMP-forming)/AMP-acid ligase II